MTRYYIAIALIAAAGTLLLAVSMMETEIVRLALKSFLESRRFGGIP